MTATLTLTTTPMCRLSPRARPTPAAPAVSARQAAAAHANGTASRGRATASSSTVAVRGADTATILPSARRKTSTSTSKRRRGGRVSLSALDHTTLVFSYDPNFFSFSVHKLLMTILFLSFFLPSPILSPSLFNMDGWVDGQAISFSLLETTGMK